MTDDAQPQENEGQGAGLYDLDSVPPELRDAVEPHLKQIGANADKKLREAAEYRKAWEPYENLGVKDIPPENLQQLLSFAQMAEDEDAFGQWIDQQATERGYAKADEGDDLGLEDELTPQKIQELVGESLQKALNPVLQRLDQQDEQRAEQEIGQQLSKLRQDNPDLPEGAEDHILKLAYAFAEDPNGDPIQKGLEEYQRIVSQGENGLLKQKSGQPGSPEGPGAAPTSPERITSFEEAKAAARERLSQSLAG